MGTEPVSLATVEVRTAAPQVFRAFRNTHVGAQDLSMQQLRGLLP